MRDEERGDGRSELGTTNTPSNAPISVHPTLLLKTNIVFHVNWALLG